MGVDVKINLPDNVRVKDVANIIGIAAGLKPRWGGSHGAKWVEVPGVEVKTTNITEMAEISIRSTGHLLIDGEAHHFVYYHFESDYGGRSLGPRSTAFWIAIAHRLVDFFGGKIDYQDCDSTEINYKKLPKAKRWNSPSDGDEWDRFQNKLFNVKPITVEELDAFDKEAAYKKAEMRNAE